MRIGENARTAHPDAGGSPEAFAQIKLAHDILTHEVLPKRYDETGEVDEPTPDNRRAQMMEMLSVALDHAMAKLPGLEVTEIYRHAAADFRGASRTVRKHGSR